MAARHGRCWQDGVVAYDRDVRRAADESAQALVHELAEAAAAARYAGQTDLAGNLEDRVAGLRWIQVARRLEADADR
jgi:hypothetical protein